MTSIALGLLALPAIGCGSGGSGGRETAGLAFTRYSRPTASSVWIAHADGSQARQIAAGAYGARLSPDGRHVAYAVVGGSTPRVLVTDVARDEPRPVGRALEYAWSPNGAQLALADRRRLEVVDAESGSRRALASGAARGISFAPDGSALAYASTNQKAGSAYRSDIFVVTLPDGRIRRLTADGHSDQPVWGARWIAYRGFHANHDRSVGRLYLRRPDGSGKRLLARGDERAGRAHFGLEPLQFSRDAKRLLACTAGEFSCPPVVLSVPSGKKRPLPLRGVRAGGELVSTAAFDLQGGNVLVDVGPFDGVAHHRVYVLPVGAGAARLIARDASDPSWAR